MSKLKCLFGFHAPDINLLIDNVQKKEGKESRLTKCKSCGKELSYEYVYTKHFRALNTMLRKRISENIANLNKKV